MVRRCHKCRCRHAAQCPAARHPPTHGGYLPRGRGGHCAALPKRSPWRAISSNRLLHIGQIAASACRTGLTGHCRRPRLWQCCAAFFRAQLGEGATWERICALAALCARPRARASLPDGRAVEKTAHGLYIVSPAQCMPFCQPLPLDGAMDVHGLMRHCGNAVRA